MSKHLFTPMEKKSFNYILKKYTAVIENKNTDGKTLRSKNQAWESITREYNASPHTARQVTSKQLRRLWMNLKQRRRQHPVANGGGAATRNDIIDPDVKDPDIIQPIIVGVQKATDSEPKPLLEEYRDRWRRAEEIHQLEKDLLTARIREAVAKAELAELFLRDQQSMTVTGL